MKSLTVYQVVLESTDSASDDQSDESICSLQAESTGKNIGGQSHYSVHFLFCIHYLMLSIVVIHICLSHWVISGKFE